MKDTNTLPIPPRTDDLNIPPAERKTMASLETDDCRWPFGDPVRPDFHFCGKSKVGDGPYCAFHMRRASPPGGPPRVVRSARPSRHTCTSAQMPLKAANPMLIAHFSLLTRDHLHGFDNSCAGSSPEELRFAGRHQRYATESCACARVGERRRGENPQMPGLPIFVS